MRRRRRKPDMAVIGPSKNTRPERVVRMWLVRNGYSHAVQKRIGPYTVDLIVHLESSMVVIEVHGRFWHCIRSSKMREMPKYWRDKLRMNVLRDRRRRGLLRKNGYLVITVWDNEIRSSVWQVRLSRLLSLPFAS